MEYRYADQRGKLVIPLSYLPTTTTPIDLRILEWVNFQSSYEEGLRLLVKRLSHLKTPAAQPEPSKPTPQAPPSEEQARSKPAENPRPKAEKAQPRVFVSHSHKNDAFTMQLTKDLRSAGVDVWVDMVNMDYGDFMKRINEALSSCEWLVLVLTPDALNSPAVENEVNAAINLVWKKRMKGFIPLMAHPCDPGTIPALWDTYHRLDATKDYRAALASLLRALGIS